jgi:hypothetical protein
MRFKKKKKKLLLYPFELNNKNKYSKKSDWLMLVLAVLAIYMVLKRTSPYFYIAIIYRFVNNQVFLPQATNYCHIYLRINFVIALSLPTLSKFV